MKKLFSIIFLSFMLFYSPAILAQEHGGKEHGGQKPSVQEHGGQEHGGKVIEKPTAQDIRDANKNYVIKKSKKTGTFDIMDPVTGKMRNLEMIRIHERVGKTGEYFYTCADFKDSKSGQLLDLDLDVEHKNGKLNVVDVRIHKVEGKPRYTYDKNDNRIPVK